MKLVVYFSRKGYVGLYAQRMAAEQGADLLELITPEKTAGKLGFWWCGRFSMHRWDMPLKAMDVVLEQYEQLIICSPIWVFSACAPVWSFAKWAKGRVRSVEYVLFHFSRFPMRYDKTVAALDRAIDARHTAYESVACMYGNVIQKRRYKNAV